MLPLWWWRDVRFWVNNLHLDDARKALSQERREARERAVEQLGQDFFERGGHEAITPDDVEALAEGCPRHPDLPLAPRTPRPVIRRPRGKLDRALTDAACEAGCHVFLTLDRDILRSHEGYTAHGMAVLTPGRLLEELDASSELRIEPDFSRPCPDLSALSRFYGLWPPTESADNGS